jgi:SulP family sulfate permease
MASPATQATGFRFPILQGILPIKRSQWPADIVAGITLAALNMGYTEIAGAPR